ncbi:MAG: group II intron maturase-specific domain-containing protein [Candidatus Dormibacteraceae bacterium]
MQRSSTVRAICSPRFMLVNSIDALVTKLNPVLRGWANYFGRGNSNRKFSQIDSYVKEQLALFDSKKRQRSGCRWERIHTHDWISGLGVFRLSGRVRYA